MLKLYPIMGWDQTLFLTNFIWVVTGPHYGVLTFKYIYIDHNYTSFDFSCVQYSSILSHTLNAFIHFQSISKEQIVRGSILLAQPNLNLLPSAYGREQEWTSGLGREGVPTPSLWQVKGVPHCLYGWSKALCRHSQLELSWARLRLRLGSANNIDPLTIPEFWS